MTYSIYLRPARTYPLTNTMLVSATGSDGIVGQHAIIDVVIPREKQWYRAADSAIMFRNKARECFDGAAWRTPRFLEEGANCVCPACGTGARFFTSQPIRRQVSGILFP